MATSSYQLELDEQARRREAYQPRQRDDEAGFVGQASYGSQYQDRAVVDPDSNPDVDTDEESPEDDAKAAAFGDLLDSILSGTAPAVVLDRATKCAMDCARMTGRPVEQFLTDAARSVAVSEIYGD